MSGATKKLFDGEEVAEVLSGTYYKARPDHRALARDDHRALSRDRADLRAIPGGEPEKPAHYKVICISLYNEDLAHLDGMVDELKRRGFTKANRSALIRFALEQVDLDQVKKGM
ncbi:MAG: hypothetical protein HYV09_04545 [Deltaproteobacteria bacterium]|nr:hypothetical protein [Deltaproteobacteria bacterium]